MHLREVSRVFDSAVERHSAIDKPIYIMGDFDMGDKLQIC